jgi:histidyl-tRNA synthetase
MSKPSVPSGMRDFSPEQVIRRNYIMGIIENVFQKYGFMPLQTPSMENIETLTGKYGDEGDQLIYKVLNSRVHEAKEEKKAAMRFDFEQMLHANFNSKNIIEKALRYDLTVPFARYVVMHRNEIAFPFKRYQMQPVWRADRPQKGRFREFWQCDADVVGSDSLLNEVDLLCIYHEVFSQLNIDFKIKINNRKILMGFAEELDAKDQFNEMVNAIDNLDKIGWDGVKLQLREIGFTEDKIERLLDFFNVKGNTIFEALENVRSKFTSEIGKKGIVEMLEIFKYLSVLDLSSSVKDNIGFDFKLARGLNYYTGSIFEVEPLGIKMGSIGGGGRYDDLTGIFGLPGVSGVGISFGLDRIYEVMEELKLFPEMNGNFTQVLFCCMDETALEYALPLAKQLRDAGIKTEIYPGAFKLKKQLDYANAKNIGYAIIIGEEEMKTNLLSLKNLTSGDQNKFGVNQILDIILMA